MEEEQLGITFIEHPSFSREIEKFNKKYDGGIGYTSLKRLLAKHFNPVKREVVFTPKILRRMDNIGANIEVYKINMAIKGLRQGQSPRVCFRYAGNLITFLCSGSHIDNYSSSQLRELIKRRVRDFDLEAQFN